MYRVIELCQTIDGEGGNTGIPIVLVRLAGCANRCPWCDTPGSWDRSAGREMPAETIANFVRTCDPVSNVLVTGGEPCEWDLSPLLAALDEQAAYVHIATSGVPDIDYSRLGARIILSPKLGIREPVRSAIIAASELKVIVGDGDDIGRFDAWRAGSGRDYAGPICLQPRDRDPGSTALCVAICGERNYRLSVQMHRYIGIA